MTQTSSNFLASLQRFGMKLGGVQNRLKKAKTAHAALGKHLRKQRKLMSKAPGKVASKTDRAPKLNLDMEEAASQFYEALQRALRDATAEINEIIHELPSEKDLKVPENAAPVAEISPREQSPVDNAIAIRDRLVNTVEFVDAAKWAKWRRVKSNPSAALGKYKKQGRVFAVRSSKQDLYPKFLFADNALPLSVIKDILAVVPKDAQGWSLLSWMEAKNALLGGRKPAEVLKDEPASVVAAAARFYSRED